MIVDAIGGMALGAYPIAIAVSDAIYRYNQNKVNTFIVRKEVKAYGLSRYIEGNIKFGDRVIIVEDVVTTGESIISAINRSREEGLEIIKVIALVNRDEFGGAQNIINHNVELESLVNIKDLI